MSMHHKLQAWGEAVRRFLAADKAVSAVEYAILVGVITAGLSAAVVAFRGDIQTAIGNVGTNIESEITDDTL